MVSDLLMAVGSYFIVVRVRDPQGGEAPTPGRWPCRLGAPLAPQKGSQRIHWRQWWRVFRI